MRHPNRLTKLHIGPIHSHVAGRTDHIPVHVPSGSYVLPADVVAAHGEHNTMAGFKVMRRLFGGVPYGGGQSPYGQGEAPYGQGAGPYGQNPGGMPYGQGESQGGAASDGDEDEGVPVVVAGGEYVLSPDEVRREGHGDLDMGHRVLDAFVKRTRAESIKTLQKLPGPRRD